MKVKCNVLDRQFFNINRNMKRQLYEYSVQAGMC